MDAESANGASYGQALVVTERGRSKVYGGVVSLPLPENRIKQCRLRPLALSASSVSVPPDLYTQSPRMQATKSALRPIEEKRG